MRGRHLRPKAPHAPTAPSSYETLQACRSSESYQAGDGHEAEALGEWFGGAGQAAPSIRSLPTPTAVAGEPQDRAAQLSRGH